MIQWVSESDRLNSLSQALPQTPLALDTEFIRERTFYPKLALVQLRCADGDELLIDPIALATPGDLKPLLEGPTLKIMHSPSEDLQALLCGWKIKLGTIFDTQTAAALTGLGAGKSYQFLVENLLGIQLQKGETRSDWLKRPLTESQCHYAAEDVRYLHEMHAILDEKLGVLGRRDWLKQECDRMLATAAQDVIDPNPHLTNRGAQRMDREAQARYRRLLVWRDQNARQRDIPRSWILDNELVVLLAQRPLTRTAFDSLLDGYTRSPRRSRSDLWEIVSRPLSEADLDLPLASEPDPNLKQTVKAMQNEVTRIATELNIPETILCSRKHIEALINQRTWPSTLKGWREGLLKDSMMKHLP